MRPQPVAEVSDAAQASLSLARAALRVAESEVEPGKQREVARQALLRAAELAPDWIAPQRMFDELERGELRGSQRYAQRLQDVLEGSATASELYLLGRLEGLAGLARFESARALQPGLAWVHHAYSVDEQFRRRLDRATDHARDALSLARTSYARALFGRRLVLLLDRTDREQEASALLDQLLEDPQLGDVERIELRVEQCRRDVVRFDREINERGLQRLLDLLREERLTQSELLALFDGSFLVSGRSTASRVHLIREALLDGPNRSWLDDDPEAWFSASWSYDIGEKFSEPVRPSGRELRLDGFRAGQPAQAVLDWYERLPELTIDGERRRWLDPGLDHLVDLARAQRESARDAELSLDFESGLTWIDLCLERGWIDEGSALIEFLIADSSDGLEGTGLTDELLTRKRRASAGQALLAEVDRLVGSLAGESKSWAATPLTREADSGQWTSLDEPDSLEEVLDRLARLVELYGEDLGWDAVADAEAVRASPLLGFGPFGRLTVPGERFHERDALLGVGKAGGSVPGLSEVLGRLGRMGLFGDAVGRAPDGTVLQLLHSGPFSGEHLGVPFSGTLLICEGADADGARSRGAGDVAGAALHEGYWIDIEPERRRLESWERLIAERFETLGLDGVRRLCEQSSLRIPIELQGRPGERARLLPVLGAGARLRLDLLAERRVERGPEAELIGLAELVEVTSVHEEGHLLDRTRFLPLGRNLGLAWGLLARSGMSALGFERRLEFRAQAVALACSPEPRLPLAQLLDSAEVDSRQPTVHAAAYTQLLAEFLRHLDRSLESRPDFAPDVDRESYLVHQLHRLSPAEIREVAEDVASSFGIDRQ